MTPGGGPAAPGAEAVAAFLRGARRIAVVGIGNPDLPADAPGMEAAAALASLGPRSAAVFPAGTVPESVTGPLRRYRPDRVLLVDAAATGRPPGSVALLRRGDLRGGFPSAHAPSLAMLVGFLVEDLGVPVAVAGFESGPGSGVGAGGVVGGVVGARGRGR